MKKIIIALLFIVLHSCTEPDNIKFTCEKISGNEHKLYFSVQDERDVVRYELQVAQDGEFVPVKYIEPDGSGFTIYLKLQPESLVRIMALEVDGDVYFSKTFKAAG